jgi:hypothetical protein
VLLAQDPVWRNKVDAIFHLSLPDKPGPSYGQFKKWLGEEMLRVRASGSK